jgi:hypothetical protein
LQNCGAWSSRGWDVAEMDANETHGEVAIVVNACRGR